MATRFFSTLSLDVIRRTRESLAYLGILIVTSAFLPCGHADAQAPLSPEEAIKSYLAIPPSQWQQRLPYISDADQAKSYMARTYASSPSTRAAENVVVMGARNDEDFMRVGDTLPLETTASINGTPENLVFYVTRDPDGYRVNWLRSCMPWLSPGTPEEVAFRQMVGVQSTDRLLPLVADPAAVKPIMEAYYSDAQNRRPGYTAEQIEYIVIHPEDDPMADGVSFRVLTKERGDQSGLLGVTWVVKTPKRGYKIDWSKTHAHNMADGNRPLIAGAQRAKTTNDLMAKRESLPAKAVRREDYKSASLRQVVNDPLDFVGKRVYFKDMSVSPGVDRDRARKLGVLVVVGDNAVSGRFVQRGEFAVVADVDMCKKLDEPLRQSGRSNFAMQRIRAQMGVGGLGEQAPDPALEAKYPAIVKRLWVTVIQSDDGEVLGCIDAIEVWTPFPTPQGTVELYQK